MERPTCWITTFSFLQKFKHLCFTLSLLFSLLLLLFLSGKASQGNQSKIEKILIQVFFLLRLLLLLWRARHLHPTSPLLQLRRQPWFLLHWYCRHLPSALSSLLSHLWARRALKNQL